MSKDANQFFEDLNLPDDVIDFVAAQKRIVEALPILSAATLINMQVPPRKDILGEALLFEHSLSALIAPPGTGKTRLTLQMAVCSLCGIDLGPLKCPQRDLKWLILAGNENSLLRYKTDLQNMIAHVPPDMRVRVLNSIYFHVTNSIEDIITAQSMDRIRETVGEIEPDVVVLDPLGDIVSGDANSDTDMRSCLHGLSRAVWGPRPDAAILIVHHAREGAQNIKQATGWDRGNFGKGSKALRAACRAVINMAPKSKDGCGGIVITCGKVNDAPQFSPFAMSYEDGWYVVDDDFDEESWIADVDGKRGAIKSCTIQDIVNFLENQPDKTATQRRISEHFGVSIGTVNARVNTGKNKGWLRVGGKGVKNTGKLTPKIDTSHQEEEL
jgi:hypothetical protein